MELDAIEDTDGGEPKPPADLVAKKTKALMQEEERATGAVSGQGASSAAPIWPTHSRVFHPQSTANSFGPQRATSRSHCSSEV